MGCARAAGMFPGIDQTGNKSSTWNTTAAHIKNTVKIRGISAGAPTYKDWPWKRSQTGEKENKERVLPPDRSKKNLAKLSSKLSINEPAVKAKKAERQLYSPQLNQKQCPEGKEGRKRMHQGQLLKAKKADSEVSQNLKKENPRMNEYERMRKLEIVHQHTWRS